MTQFIYHKAGNTEAQQKQALAFLLQQDSPGLASDGVLSGLGVSQTATASASVVVAAGSGASQDTVLNGASMLVLDSPFTLDVLGANPVGGLPRNDVVVFDAATVSSGAGGVRVLTGVPNASPTDPTVPATAVPLARLRHAASATTVPAAKIDDLRAFTHLNDGRSASKASKRFHWSAYTTAATDSGGYVTVTHGAGFTPTAVLVTAADTTFASKHAYAALTCDTFTSTTFRLRAVDPAAGAGIASQAFTISVMLGE